MIQVLRYVAANLARLVLAATFLFSGFVKANDPLGFAYKLGDYATALDITTLPSFALLFAAIALAVMEFALGVYIFFHINGRRMGVLSIAFMAVMTLVTIYIYIYSPVEDCGCFGDVLILSNGATLAKNIVLLSLAMVYAWLHKYQVKFISGNTEWIVSTFSILFILAFSVHSVRALPVLDFRPYCIGTNLREAVEGSDSPDYDIRIVYQRGDETLELTTDDDDPDSTWKYVETRRIPVGSPDGAFGDVKWGVSSSASEFYVENTDGEDITDDIIYDEGYVFLVVIPNLYETDEGCTDKLNALYDYCVDNGYSMYCLTASSDTIDHAYWNEHTGSEYPFAVGDERMLKTIVRSSPGLVLLHDGMVVNKWSNTKMPVEEELTSTLDKLPLAVKKPQTLERKLVTILFCFLVPLLLFVLVDRLAMGWQFYRKWKRRSQEILLQKETVSTEECEVEAPSDTQQIQG